MMPIVQNYETALAGMRKFEAENNLSVAELKRYEIREGYALVGKTPDARSYSLGWKVEGKEGWGCDCGDGGSGF